MKINYTNLLKIIENQEKLIKLQAEVIASNERQITIYEKMRQAIKSVRQ